MTSPELALPKAVLAEVVLALPGSYLWDGASAIDNADVVVFDAIVPPKPPKLYAVVYVDDGTLSALAVCNESDSANLRWQVTAVAPYREQASWVASKIRFGSVGKNPAANGWATGKICHELSEPPGRDETVPELPVIYKIDRYDLLATRV